jgi:hypothetical protein
MVRAPKDLQKTGEDEELEGLTGVPGWPGWPRS